MKKQSAPYRNRAHGPALVLELPAAVSARLAEPVVKQAPPVPVVRQSADEIIDWRQGGEYKAARHVTLLFTELWDREGRPIFMAVGETL